MRSPSRARARAFGLLTVLLLASSIGTGSAATTEGADSNVIPVEQCTAPSHERAADGTYRQSFDAVEDQGIIAAIPPRTALETGPGEATKICVGFQNRTDGPITLELSTSDVGVDKDGAPLTTGAEEEFGAADWIELPTDEVEDLAKGDIAWMVVDVAVDEDATAGSWYASIKATVPPPKAKGSGVQIVEGRSVISQVFFDIPGEVARGGKVVDLRAPRIVWWDGLNVGDLPVLDKLRGLGVASVRFDWHNTGDYTDVVEGRLGIESDLGGKRVANLEIGPQTVIRGAKRDYEVTWSKDIPFVGRFTPTLEMTGRDGRTQTLELDPIWVIPSWTYLLALAIAIGIPLWWRRRSKRRYQALVARVEAAEARSDQGTSEDWDDSSDEWQ